MGTHNTKNEIEINGKRYDAVTGAFLGERPAGPPAQIVKSRGQHLDGFRRVSRASQGAAPVLQPIPNAIAHTAKPVHAPKTRQPHAPAMQVNPHKPQPAKTLMRSAVKKPDVKAPSVIKAQTRTDILAKVPVQTVAVKLPHTKVDGRRLRRAERIIQSPSVSKYRSAPVATTPVSIAKPVQQPVSRTAVAVTHAPAVRSELRAPRQHFQPHTGTPQAAPVRIQRASAVAVQRPVTHSPHHDVLERTIAEAHHESRSHNRKRKQNRLVTAASVSLAMLLLIGFLGYQNMPYISMRVAAYQAGIQAKMPTYSPVGFTFGNLSYTPGNVTVSYYNQDNGSQSFDITQKASEWNSKALLDNFVTTTSKSYETIERAGRTFYLYGNNTATWVDNGIWYTIDGNQSLNNSQLLDVALSI